MYLTKRENNIFVREKSTTCMTFLVECANPIQIKITMQNVDVFKVQWILPTTITEIRIVKKKKKNIQSQFDFD